jgi:hypothetical protein
LKRAAAAAESDMTPPSLESIIAAVSADQPTDRRGKSQFLVVGLALLAVVAPISMGIAVVMLSSGLTPLGRIDQTTAPPAPSAAPTISAAGANRPPSGAERASVQIGERAAPTGSQSKEDASAPPVALLRDPAASAAANRHVAAVEPKTDTPAPEMGQREPQHEATALEQATPAAPRPPPAATSSSPAPAASPTPATASRDSKALAEANSRIAAIEGERDALAAEVARLERQEKSSSPHEASPPPPAAAASPTPLPAGPPAAAEAGLDLSSAASATLPQGMPARVLIRYSGNGAEARRRAESLANALSGQGIEVADLRESAAAIRTELSFSYAPDEAIAQQVGRLVGVAPVRRLQAKDSLMARPGTLELNLSGDSHLAAIKTTSTRESDHE